jgi:antitoxin component YwqK of YwqJK toxin-antitoxin module
MKKLIFILLLTIPFIGFGQNRYYIDEVTEISDTLIYLKKDKSLVNGILFGDFGDFGMCQNGKKHGYWRFYRNGNLMSEGTWIDNKKNGIFNTYSDDGNKESRSIFKNHNFWEFITYKNGNMKILMKNGKWR